MKLVIAEKPSVAVTIAKVNFICVEFNFTTYHKNEDIIDVVMTPLNKLELIDSF